jgi:hypothetical protein
VYSGYFVITNLAARGNPFFCSLSLKEQSVWAARE